ncbi:MAG: PAS domain S-box protein [Verrucomicrobia bacterium]|nr:PAS domain S-box protein [Verrucomicrobiota bacterium]
MDADFDSSKLFTDISLLYELSLAAGHSLDLEENCDIFLKTLMRRKNLGFASVWLRTNAFLHTVVAGETEKPLHEQTGILVYAHPRFRIEKELLPLDHPVFTCVRGDAFFSIGSTDPRFPEFVVERNMTSGSYAIFPLGELGILKLLSVTREAPFAPEEMRALSNVVAKFSVSLEGCLAHRKVIIEVAERKEAEDDLLKARDELERRVDSRTTELSEANRRLHQEVMVRQKAERALQDQYKFLQAVIDTMPSPVFYKDAEGHYLGCNTAFEQAIGITRKEIAGKTVFDVAPSELAQVYEQKDGELYEKSGVQTYESLVKFKDGTLHDIVFSKGTFANADGSIAGLVGIMLDITKLRENERQLRAAEAKYRLLVEQLPAITYIVELGEVNRTTYISPQIETLLGYTTEEWLADPDLWMNRIHGEDKKHIVEEVSEKNITGGSFSLEYRVRTKSNSEVWFRNMATYLRDDEGRPAFVHGVMLDITEMKRAQEKQKVLADGLRSVVVATDELIGCEGIDIVCRRAVELAREILGAERCGIFLDKGDHIEGTYGTGIDGETTDEHGNVFPLPSEWETHFEVTDDLARRWHVEEVERYQWEEGKLSPLGRGWVSAIPIAHAGRRPIAVLFNDAAISESPVDPVRQDILAVFCSVLAGIIERKEMEAAATMLAQALEERVKELTALYDIATLIEEKGSSLDELLQGVADMCLSGFQYPEVCCAKLTLRGREYFSPEFEDTEWRIATDIILRNEKQGELVVCYTEERPSSSRGPFLREERRLLEGISERVARTVERLEAEKALRESEKKFRQTSELLPETVFEMDADGTLTFVNRRGLEVFGYTRKDLENGLNVMNLLTKNDRQRAQEHVVRVLKGEQMGGTEYVALKKNGVEFPIVTHTAAIVQDGHPIGLRGIAIDYTERKKVEEQLRIQSMALEAADNSIVLTDADGVILWVNPAFERSTGYSFAEVIGRKPSILKSGKHSASFYKKMWDKILSGKVWHGEIQNRTKDGALYVEEMTVTPVINAEGRITHFIGIKQDMTERKRLEEEQRQAEHRERELIERTDRLSSLGVLAAGVAHEVNNPLQGMLSHLNAVRRAVPGDFRRIESIDMVERGIETIADLVRKLLTLGANPEHFEELSSCHKPINTVIQLMGPEFKHSGVKIERRLSPEDHSLAISEGEVTQILLNILINARDAMPNGGTVAIENEFKDRLCVLRIRDTGIGIAAEDLANIFTPFFTTKGTKGFGLGLSVAESIARSHGGRLDVESEQGKGTCFTLYLPLAEVKKKAKKADLKEGKKEK